MFLRNASIVSVLGFVVLVTFSPVALGQGVESSTPRGLDVVLLLDSSESTRTTDPNDHRLTAAHFLLDYLEATSELLRVNHWAAVANFGGKVGAGATPLRLVGQGRVHDAIRKELIRDTDFRPALEFALRAIRDDSTETGRQTIVVLFTDGLPALNSDTLEGEALANYFRGDSIPNDPLGTRLDRLVDELNELGGELFVVAVGQKPEAAEGWRSLLPDNHYLELEDTSQLASAYHQIFSRRFGFEGVEQYELEEGQPIQIDFEPLVEHATLTFLKDDPEARLTLEASGDQAPRRVVGGGPDELHEVYELITPSEEDVWTASLARGQARLLVAQRRPALVIQEPFSPQPVGAPLFLLASVDRREDATPLPKVTMLATVTGPGFSEPHQQELSALENQQFRLITSKPALAGEYTIHLEAHLGHEGGPSIDSVVKIQTEQLPEILSVQLDRASLLDQQQWAAKVLLKHAGKLGPRSRLHINVKNGGTTLATTTLGREGLVATATKSEEENEFELLTTPVELPKGTDKPTTDAILSGATANGLAYVHRHLAQQIDRGFWYLLSALTCVGGFVFGGYVRHKNGHTASKYSRAFRPYRAVAKALEKYARKQAGTNPGSGVVQDACKKIESLAGPKSRHFKYSVLNEWLKGLAKTSQLLNVKDGGDVLRAISRCDEKLARSVADIAVAERLAASGGRSEDGTELMLFLEKFDL